jgi:hypothetical protein
VRSFAIIEPVGRAATFIDERPEEFEENGDVFSCSRGELRVAPEWKAYFSAVTTAAAALEKKICDTVVDSLGARLAAELSNVPGVERVFLRRDEDFFRVWTVIADMDLATEDRIYAAQFAFMDRFPEIPFDFSVIFRQGRDAGTLKPAGAHEAPATR